VAKTIFSYRNRTVSCTKVIAPCPFILKKRSFPGSERPRALKPLYKGLVLGGGHVLIVAFHSLPGPTPKASLLRALGHREWPSGFTTSSGDRFSKVYNSSGTSSHQRQTGSLTLQSFFNRGRTDFLANNPLRFLCTELATGWPNTVIVSGKGRHPGDWLGRAL